MKFSAYVRERIGWYVYALRNPRTKRVFYVGKGKGNRVFQHAQGALDDPDGESDKFREIRSIRRSGRTVESFILRHGISSEKLAYEIESAVMDALTLSGCPLTGNLVEGHGHGGRGLAHTSVVASLYKAPRATAIRMPAILIRIPANWTPQMTAEELYEATRGWWKLAPYRCEKVKTVFSVSNGVIRAVYRVKRWRPRRKGDRDWKDDIGKRSPRWGFDGREAPELARYLNTSVAHRYKQGAANPVTYVNC